MENNAAASRPEPQKPTLLTKPCDGSGFPADLGSVACSTNTADGGARDFDTASLVPRGHCSYRDYFFKGT